MIIFYYNDNKQNDDKHIEKIFKDIKNQNENNFVLDEKEKASKESFDKDIKSECVKHSLNVNLKRLRKSLNLTQEQLAEALNIPFRTIMNWERGVREPSAKNLCMLSQYFNVHPIDLMGTSLGSPSIINEEFMKKCQELAGTGK